MPLKAEGIAVLVILIVLCILLLMLGVYCHFCGERESGGHLYNSKESIAVMFTKKAEGGPTKNKSRCKCSNRFKGYCRDCEGESFTEDDGKTPDFSDFGGDQGLDSGKWGNKPDPIRSALGGGGGGNSGMGGESGASGHDSGTMMRDD